MSSITIFPAECWSIAEWYFLWQAAGFIHGRWWRGSTEEPKPSPGRSRCRLLELTGSFIYFIHLQPPTIILLQSSSLSSAGSGTLNTDAMLVRISVVRRQILDPDCIFVQSDVMHHRISPPNYDVEWLPVLVSWSVVPSGDVTTSLCFTLALVVVVVVVTHMQWWLISSYHRIHCRCQSSVCSHHGPAKTITSVLISAKASAN